MSTAAALSQAQYLFEHYTRADAASVLQALPSQMPPVFETEKLDFKTGAFNPQHLERIFSKALGAFANNAGGVLVWGINASKDPTTGIDAARAVEPVADVHKLVNRLKGLHPFATDPPIKGVESVGVPIPGQEPAGFVVTFVPESSFKPHRSEQDGKRFYLRMGDSGRECSVSILRQLFYPSLNPRIEVTFRPYKTTKYVQRFSHIIEGEEVTSSRQDLVIVRIRNIGATSLRDLWLAITCGKAELSFLEAEHNVIYTLKSCSRIFSLADSLHPGMSVEQKLAVDLRPDDPNPIWEIRLYSMDAEPLVSSHDHVQVYPVSPITENI